jgi:hypothetical protein
MQLIDKPPFGATAAVAAYVANKSAVNVVLNFK